MSIPQPREDNAAQDIDALRRLLAQDLAAVAPIANIDTPVTPTAAASWLENVRGKNAVLRHPRLAFFCRTGGDGIDQMTAMRDGIAEVAQLTALLNGDLQVYEVPATADSQDSLLQAIAYGMAAVQPGLDVLGVGCLDDFSAGNIPATLDGLLETKRPDIAALCGAVIAARLARVPVIGSGTAFDFCITLLRTAHPAAATHMVEATHMVGSDTHDLPARIATAVAYLKSTAALNGKHQ